MAKLKIPETAGFNAGKSYYAKPFRVEDIVIDPEIAAIFDISDDMRCVIAQHIRKYGYDKSQPCVIQKGTNKLLDGHTRLAAAKEAGLEEIPVVEMDFEDWQEAVLYTISRQMLRRQLKGPQVMTFAEMLPDTRKKADGTGKAVEMLADRIGISRATMYQALAILKEAPEDIKQAVKDGNMSVKKGYSEHKKRTKPQTDIAGERLLGKHWLFLKDAVTLLVEANKADAAELLVGHFIDQDEKNSFYELLPDGIREHFIKSVSLPDQSQ